MFLATTALEAFGVQILYYSPEQAAEKLVEICEDLGSWWNGGTLQKALRQFVAGPNAHKTRKT